MRSHLLPESLRGSCRPISICTINLIFCTADCAWQCGKLEKQTRGRAETLGGAPWKQRRVQGQTLARARAGRAKGKSERGKRTIAMMAILSASSALAVCLLALQASTAYSFQSLGAAGLECATGRQGSSRCVMGAMLHLKCTLLQRCVCAPRAAGCPMTACRRSPSKRASRGPLTEVWCWHRVVGRTAGDRQCCHGLWDGPLADVRCGVLQWSGSLSSAGAARSQARFCCNSGRWVRGRASVPTNAETLRGRCGRVRHRHRYSSPMTRRSAITCTRGVRVSQSWPRAHTQQPHRTLRLTPATVLSRLLVRVCAGT